MNWNSRIIGLTSLLVMLIIMSTHSFASGVEEIAPRRFQFQVDETTVSVPFHCNYDINLTQPSITRVIIAIHGMHRESRVAYDNIQYAATLEDEGTVANCLILAPQFLIEKDINRWALDTQHLFWKQKHWFCGGMSRSSSENPRSAHISSFAILDSLVGHLVSVLPNLETIVLTGNSGGGRMIQRYALAGVAQNYYPDYTFIYAFSNPGNYCYLGPERPTSDGANSFALPADNTVESCPQYNTYPYGLEGLNEYLAQSNVEQMLEWYAERNVAILLGENDNDPNARALDNSCEGRLQGNHRVQRGMYYYYHTLSIYEGGTLPNHALHVVDDARHPGAEMFPTPIYRHYLFSSETVDAKSSQFINYTLRPIFPNPTNKTVGITVDVYATTGLEVEVLDILGRCTIQFKRHLPSGTHSFNLNMSDHSSGTYFITIRDTSGRMEERKVTLLK